MIDTDKYEGHTEGPWSVYKETPDVLETDEWIAEMKIYNQATGDDVVLKQCDTQLIADAPLLLEEVKRLRSTIDYIREVGKMDRKPSGFLLSIMEQVLTTEEYLEWRNEE